MTKAPSPPIPFIDNLSAPDIFSDGATGWLLLNGNIRITFEAVRSSYGAGPGLNRVVIGRLVLPVDQAEQMATGLLEFIKQQRAKVSTTEPAQGTPTLN